MIHPDDLETLIILLLIQKMSIETEIDKLVDFHNETLNKVYVTVGGLSTAYCETLVMGTVIGKVSGVQTLSFKSAVIETGEDVMTDQIAGCIDETLGGANPVKRMVALLSEEERMQQKIK